MAYSASDISKAVSLAIIFAFTVVGNTLVALVLIKFRRHLFRNRPTYQFILNIVLSDLVVGLLTMPFEFVRELLDEWIFGTTACKIIDFLEIAVFGTAVLTHSLVAYDRYCSLTTNIEDYNGSCRTGKLYGCLLKVLCMYILFA